MRKAALKLTVLAAASALAFGGGVMAMPHDREQTTINVLFATYGATCNVHPGNVTRQVKAQCDGRRLCPYTIDHKVIGDPAMGCRKDYKVIYMCGNDGPYVETAPAEATGATVRLRCR